MQEPTTKAEVFELEETVKDWDQDYYHPIAEKYYDDAVSTMLKLMEVSPGATVLDAGCGPGVHSIRVAKENFQVVAVDISKTMLEEAKKRIENAGVSGNIKFQQEDLTALSFADASFDYVFSWGVIIHIHEIQKALDELTRIVAPKGKLALYITNKQALDHPIEAIARFFLRKPSGQEKLAMGNGVWYDFNGQRLWVWQFDTNAVTKYLEARGFRKTHHIIGELTENQRRVGGILRILLLKLSNLCYKLKLPPAIGSTNLLVFEKIK